MHSLSGEFPGTQNLEAAHHNPGRIASQMRAAYRRAAYWLGQRRVWAKRASASTTLPPSSLAEELAGVQREMLRRTRMPIRIGAAPTLTVARTASRLAGPAGVRVVPAGQERHFLAPLSVSLLYGLSPQSVRMLQALGVVTIGELQRVPKATLQAEFGAEGLRIWSSARGLDTSSVGQSAKGVSAAVGAKAVATLANAELPRQTVLTGRAARVIGLLHKVAL